MDCNCRPNISSWYDLQDAQPNNPFDLIEYSRMANVDGVFEYSSDFLNSGTWVATPITVVDGNSSCQAWESDNKQKVGDAQMWTQQHLITNSPSTVAVPLRKQMFMRVGDSWVMLFKLAIAVELDSIQLSFLNNAGTRGDEQGTVPVIRFDPPGGTWSIGSVSVKVTLSNSSKDLLEQNLDIGTDPLQSLRIGLKSDATTSGDQAMMEMDWVMVR